MLKCESLNKILNGDKSVNYFKFKNDILVFIKDYMKDINKNFFLYLPDVTYMNSDVEFGYSYGNRAIGINENVLKNIYKGNRLYLLHIFHEIAHIKFVTLIHENKTNPMLIDIIKEYLLYEMYDEYYDYNYKYESSEVQADLEAINMLIDYFNDNYIVFKRCELYKLKTNIYILNKKLKNKKRKYFNRKNKKYEIKDFNVLFDEVVENNSKWLNWYPQLELEYYKDDGVVKKINKKT